MKKLIPMTLLALLVVVAMTGCKKSYTITVKSNNDSLGTVTGSGTYKDGEIVTISAAPVEGYYFNCWNDGNTENPRKIVVSGDETFIATFSDVPNGGGDTENALEVSGSIRTSTTWPDRGAGVDYIIDGHLYVDGNALLTVEPGVTIMFTGVDGAIVVEGNAGLRMVGTADNPITLTGLANNHNPGAWRCVEIASNRNDNQLEYVYFVNGGYGGEVLYMGGKLSMKNCIIFNSETNGVTFDEEGLFTDFTNNTIKNCGGYPMVLPDHFKVNCLGSGNNFVNNSHNMILVNSYWIERENETITYTNQGIPYYLADGLRVSATSIMKVNAGVEFVVNKGKEVGVDENALLQVDGNVSQPVVFRGLSNENGFWEGIDIESERQTNGGSYLNYCDILNAGNDSDDAALDTDEDTRLSLNHVSISGSIGYGMKISIPLDLDTEQYDFTNYHVTASGLNFTNCAHGNIYETNKNHVFSNWPGNKQLARK